MKILYLSLETKLKEFNAQHTHTFSLAKYLSRDNKLFLVVGGVKKSIIQTNNFNILTVKYNPPIFENPIIKFIKLFYNQFYLLFAILTYWDKYDIIYERCRIGMFTGLMLSKIFGKPLVYELNGILDEEMFEEGHIKNRFLQKIITKLFIMQLLNAKSIIVQTSELKNIIKSKIKTNKLFVVENGAEPVSTTYLGKKNKKINLIFVGALGKSHNLENVFEAISNVKEDFIFTVIGDGDLKSYYIKEFSHDRRFLFKGQLKHNDAIKYINNSDICIASYPSDYVPFKKYGFYFCPLKLLEYSDSGKPTILFSLSNSFTRVFEEGNACYVVNSKNDFIDKLLYMINNKEIIKTMGKNAKKIAKSFTWEIAAEKTLRILNYEN